MHLANKHVGCPIKASPSSDTSAFFHVFFVCIGRNTTGNFSIQLTITNRLKLARGLGGWDLLIFQPHPPHIIPNSMRPLHDLSHSTIIFRRARSPYQHVILKPRLQALLSHKPLSVWADNRTSGKPLYLTSLLLELSLPLSNLPWLPLY